MSRATKAAFSATVLLLAGCGGGNSPSGESSAESTGEGFSGRIVNVPEPPDASPTVTGTARMTIGESGTTVTVDASGLDPKALYVAHLHELPCTADDPGGGHFKFDPKGEPVPPNEIHVSVNNDGGKGTGEARSDSRVPSPPLRSVVIHLKRAAGAPADEPKPPKLACADLTMA